MEEVSRPQELRLIGEFSRSSIGQYCDLLEGADIPVYVNDTSNVNLRGRGLITVQLYVAKDDYDKGLRMVKDYEAKCFNDVAQESKPVDRMVFLVLGGILVFFVIFIIARGG